MAEAVEKPTVLVVEDEPALVELYVRWLEDNYDVRTAGGGEEALGALSDEIKVVLLDRLMPGMSGDEVLEELREQIDDCKVAMVTAVEPDFDVLEMGFDDYLTKPVDREELLETVERLLARSEFADLEQELFALASKQAALQSSKPHSELLNNDEFVELETRIADLRTALDETLPGMESDEFVALVREIDDVDDRADPTSTDGDDSDWGSEG